MLPSSRVRLLPCQRSSAENLFAAPRFAARVLSAPSTSAMQCPVGRSSWGVSLKWVCTSYIKSPLTSLVPQPTFSSQMRTMSSTDLLCKCSEDSVTVDETFKDGPTVILQSQYLDGFQQREETNLAKSAQKYCRARSWREPLKDTRSVQSTTSSGVFKIGPGHILAGL